MSLEDPTQTKSVNVEMAPIPAVIIGGTGPGTGNGLAPSHGVAITDSAHQPNIAYRFISPMMAITVRFITAYLTTFVGLLTAAGLGGGDFFPTKDLQQVIVACAWGSASVAGVGLLKNMITIFSNLEGKFPLATGSV